MDITLRIPDQVWNEDPTYPEYFKALQAMVDRMAMSHFKYGRIDNNAKCAEVDEIASGMQRMDMYNLTGNIENLYDAANFFVIESVYPKHKKAHFKSQTSSESPGLIYKE